MSLVFVDYTKLYYAEIAKTAVPLVTTGKFVQIRNESTLYHVFSPPAFTKYHANIVERFCLDKGIEGSYDPGRKRYDMYDRAWKVLGGGKFERDSVKKAARFYDNSMAYGKFDKSGLREMIDALPEFSGFTVLIE